MTKDGVAGYRNEIGSLSQWTFPLGLKFDCAQTETLGGWKLGPSVELAYVRAAGDTKSRTRMTAPSGTAREFLTAVTDENSFRAEVNLSARKANFMFGLNLKGQFSSSQRDIGASLTGRWEF